MRPEVETRYGRIRGTESSGVRSFRGVRFAGPVHGKGRFLPPAPPEPWSGVQETVRAGAPAPQFSLPWFGWINAAGGQPDEDCLSLSVWTPGLDAARRPVLVWIHGGAFLVGAGSTLVYDGSDLAQRGDVVVVNINYRLGALGYTHLKLLLGDEFERSSNLGVRDQIAALEWVRDHIDRFGGDPGNVTVFGQSAGAMSIGALLGAPRARSLFQRAICMSGAADHVIDADRASRTASTLLERLGGPPPSAEALGRIPLERLMRAQNQTLGRLVNQQALMVFLPVVDGDVIPEQPLDAIRNGAAAHIPLMVGTTLDEWQLFRLIDEGPRAMRERQLMSRFEEALGAGFPYAPRPEAAARDYRAALGLRSRRTRPGDVWSAFQAARVMHFPATRLAEAQHAGGGQAHAYLFTWRPPAMRKALGACHGLDIPFVFGSTQHPLARPLTGITPSAVRLSRKIQQSWIRFARCGHPEHERLPDWTAYDGKHRATMILGRECGIDNAPLEAERDLLARWTGYGAGALAPRAARTGNER